MSALVDADGRPLRPGGEPFTHEQAVAIERRDGPLLLAAAAGSGKTTVLAERFVHMCVTDGIEPGRILALTFTDKAAGEMRGRIRARLTEAGERELALATDDAWISTIHGFCARVLRAHAVGCGLDPAFTVLDEARARAMRSAAFDTALAGFLDSGGQEAVDLVAAYGTDAVAEIVGRTHDTLRSRGETRPTLPLISASEPDTALLQPAARAALDALAGANGVTVERARAALERCLAASSPARIDSSWRFGVGNTGALKGAECAAYLELLSSLEQARRDHLAAHALTRFADLLGRYADAYADIKRGASAVDYDDLELKARDLLRDAPGVRATLVARFDRIMVDEYQDTNPLQQSLLDLLDAGATFKVGDRLQSIYGFRHADVRVFEREHARLDAEGATATLATNFRSDPEILAAVNGAFAPLLEPGYVALQAPPGARTDPTGPPAVELLVTDSEGWDPDPGLPPAHAWRQAEARLVAARVARLVREEGFAAADIAVLMRAATDMVVYERAIEREGIATLASGGRGYWARQPVLDLCAFLAVLANPRDERALFSLLGSPLVGAQSGDLALLAAAAEPGHRWEALQRTGRGVLTEAAGWIEEEREVAPRLPIAELIARAVRRSNYDLHVLGLTGGRRRLANVHKLERLAAAFEARAGRDLRAFIDHAKAELDAEAREPEAPVEMGGSDAVALMTMHAAKGLEFPAVVLADLGRDAKSRPPALIAEDGRIGLRLQTLEGDSGDALDREALAAQLRERELAEDRRLGYVAMTRACRRLILAGTCRIERWPGARAGGAPLAWLGPALVPGLPAALEESDREFIAEPDHGGRRWRVRVVRNRCDDGWLTPAPRPRQGRAVPVHHRPEGQLVLEAQPPRAPLPPVTLSYSSLTSYLACPYRFHLERVLRLPADELAPEPGGVAADMDARVRGSIVHELLEKLDFTAPRPPSSERVREVAASHGQELSDAGVADVAGLVGAFGTSPLCARLAASSVRREHGFAFVLDDKAGSPLVTGYVDVVAHGEGGEVLIVDYKSDAIDPDAAPGELVTGAYEVQRRIYALAALRDGAPAVEVAHVFLERPHEPSVASFTAADAPALAASLAKDAAGLIAGEFPVAAEPHIGLCGGCPGRRALCVHPPESTSRPAPGEPPGHALSAAASP